MSLNKEIKELNEERIAEGEKSRKFYAGNNVPGDRTMNANTAAARKRIAAMREEREAAGQENPIQ